MQYCMTVDTPVSRPLQRSRPLQLMEYSQFVATTTHCGLGGLACQCNARARSNSGMDCSAKALSRHLKA